MFYLSASPLSLVDDNGEPEQNLFVLPLPFKDFAGRRREQYLKWKFSSFCGCVSCCLSYTLFFSLLLVAFQFPLPRAHNFARIVVNLSLSRSLATVSLSELLLGVFMNSHYSVSLLPLSPMYTRTLKLIAQCSSMFINLTPSLLCFLRKKKEKLLPSVASYTCRSLAATRCGISSTQ